MIADLRAKLQKILIKEAEEYISEDLLDTIVLDMSRVADSYINKLINNYKKEVDIVITSLEKNYLRKLILGYDLEQSNYKGIDEIKNEFNKEEYLEEAYNLIFEGINRNKQSVIGSLVSRVKIDKDINKKYKSYIDEAEGKYYQLLYYKVQDDNDVKRIFTSIKDLYDSLENYHQCIIEFGSDCSWLLISQIAIYLENFKTETHLNAFKEEKKISELKDHINKYKLSGNSSTINNQIKALYKGVNYGFHFNDLVITNDGKNKLLVLQKIELDESYVPCPDCF